jgi:hypothetical protein
MILRRNSQVSLPAGNVMASNSRLGKSWVILYDATSFSDQFVL